MTCKSLSVFCVQAVLAQVVFGYGIENNAATFPITDVNVPPSNFVLSGSTCANIISPGSIIAPSITSSCASLLPPASLENLLANSRSVLDSISYGGAFTVSSGSQIAPNGITVIADNLVADGNVEVSGKMPFSGSVSLDGNLPSDGIGNVVYNAGPEVSINSAGCGIGLPGLSATPALNGFPGLNLGTLNNANIAALNRANVNTLNLRSNKGNGNLCF